MRTFKPVRTVAALGAVAAPLFAIATIGTALADDSGASTIALWGDLPYSAAQAAAIPALLADINDARVRFSVHDGDLKAGSGTACDDNLYNQAFVWLNTLKAPAMFTPGDNDWTDCDRASNGGYNSRERLDHERQVFFSSSFSLGQHRIHQEVQTEKLCLNAAGASVGCVENRRWTVGSVTYATLNIQGSCNNLCDTNPDPAEYAARNAADIKWMQDTFTEAQNRHSAAVMLISQADPGFDQTDVTRSPLRDPNTLAETDMNPDGFQQFLLALRDQVIAFRKPVAYVHGDSHYFRIDKPFLNALGQRLENFTRVETFGDNQQNGTNDVNWLKVYVNPRSREVFSYQPMIVPANRTAVPPP